MTADASYATVAKQIRTQKLRLGTDALRALLAETLHQADVATPSDMAGLEDLGIAVKEALGGTEVADAVSQVAAERREAVDEERALTGVVADAAPLRQRLLEALIRWPLTASEMSSRFDCSAEATEELAAKLAGEWLILPWDDPRQDEPLYVLSLQGARWIDRHGAFGTPVPSPGDDASSDRRPAVAPDQELPIAGHPLALVCKAGGWSVVPSYFAAVSAHLPPDTVESRATMAFGAGRWCSRHALHQRAFIMRSLAEIALADAIAEDPPSWWAQAMRRESTNRWPPAGAASTRS